MSSTWTIKFAASALKDLKKLNQDAKIQITEFLNEKVQGSADARAHGKSLHGELKEYWSYRTGNYRIIAKLEDKKVQVLALAIGNRREIYKAKSGTLQNRYEQSR